MYEKILCVDGPLEGRRLAVAKGSPRLLREMVILAQPPGIVHVTGNADVDARLYLLTSRGEAFAQRSPFRQRLAFEYHLRATTIQEDGQTWAYVFHDLVRDDDLAVQALVVE